MTETDIEISGDADKGIEKDKERGQILGGTILEGSRKGREEIGGRSTLDRSDDAEKCVCRRDEEEEEKEKGFLEAENDGEIIG